jgi:ABC-2 type transport system permease protein
MSTDVTVRGPLRPPTAPDGALPRLRWALADGSVAAQRLLTKLRHDPSSIVMTLSAPVLMVLIFGYIFGSAIVAPGHGSYREYLLPGLFVTIAGNVVPSMVQTARDSSRGVIDRFRSMPIARVAIPLGHAAAQAVYGLITLLLMSLCGLAIGWRAHRGPVPTLAALGLLLAFQIAMTWLGMYLGLVIGKEDTAAQLAVLALPIGMISNIFVPTAGMPDWLRVISDWNPMSAVASAVRGLFGNPNAPTNGAWPLEHAVTASLIWTVVLLVVLVPLCSRRYAHSAS